MDNVGHLELAAETPDTQTILLFHRPPTHVQISASSVLENAAVGTAVGTFSATDPDLPDDSHVSELVTGEGDANNGLFTIDGNQRKTAAVFDYESRSSYSILVRATDSGDLWYEEVFSISVNR